MKRPTSLLVSVLLGLAAPAWAGEDAPPPPKKAAPSNVPSTPAAGSKERKALMDALRKPVEKELKTRVVFLVSTLNVLGDWAFLSGKPQQPNGKPVDYSKSPYQEMINDGVFDDGISALLKKKGGRWTVVVYSLGATDVPWVEWPEKHKAPKELFPAGL